MEDLKVDKPVRALMCGICDVPGEIIYCDICDDLPAVNVPCTKWTC